MSDLEKALDFLEKIGPQVLQLVAIATAIASAVEVIRKTTEGGTLTDSERIAIDARYTVAFDAMIKQK